MEVSSPSCVDVSSRQGSSQTPASLVLALLMVYLIFANLSYHLCGVAIQIPWYWGFAMFCEFESPNNVGRVGGPSRHNHHLGPHICYGTFIPIS